MHSVKRKIKNTSSLNSPKIAKVDNNFSETTIFQEAQTTENANTTTSKASVNFLLNTEPSTAAIQPYSSPTPTSCTKNSPMYELSDKEIKALDQNIAIGTRMGSHTVFTAEEFEAIIEQKTFPEKQNKNCYVSNHTLVEGETGQPTLLRGDELNKAIIAGTVLNRIQLNSLKQLHTSSEEPVVALSKKRALKKASPPMYALSIQEGKKLGLKDNVKQAGNFFVLTQEEFKAIIEQKTFPKEQSKYNYVSTHMLVERETGQPTLLRGDELNKAIIAGTVLNRIQLSSLKQSHTSSEEPVVALSKKRALDKANPPVYALSMQEGEELGLKDNVKQAGIFFVFPPEELKAIVQQKKFPKKQNKDGYVSHHKLVERETGKPTLLRGDELNKAIIAGTVINRSQFNNLKQSHTSSEEVSVSLLPSTTDSPADVSNLSLSKNGHSPSIANNTFSFFSPLKSIKQEPASLVENPQIDLAQVKQKLSDWMKGQRNGNNTLDNCSHLTYHALLAVENLLNGKEISQSAIPTSPSADATPTEIKYSYVPIKTEDGKRRGKQLRTAAIASVTTTEGLHSILPPVAQTVIDVTSEPIKETSIVDLEPKKVPATKIKHTAINKELMQLAKEKNKVLIGTVDLAYTGRQHISHSIVFCVTPEEIFYLDGQLHNGITKQGEPIFSNLTAPFEFATTVYGKTEGDFADDCFYTVYRELTVELKPESNNFAMAFGE